MLNCVPEGRLTGVGSGAGAGAGAEEGVFTVLVSATVLCGALYLVESFAEELDLRERAEGFTAATEGGARFEAVCGGLSPAGDPMVPAAAAGVTCRLLITVLTPVTWAASLAAAFRAASLLTLPVRVTTPFEALTLRPLSGKDASALILF